MIYIIIIYYNKDRRVFIYPFIFFCFFGYENFRNLIFGPSFRQPARKASSGEIYLKNKDLYATDL